MTTNRRRQLVMGALGGLGLTLPFGALALGPQPPDQVDVFFLGGLRPQVELLLDHSCSMGQDANAQACPWYQNSGPEAPVGSGQMSKKIHQLKASLIGCASSNDGVIDKWSSKVTFAIREFNASSSRVADFGADHDALESAVTGISPGGSTGMSAALKNAGVDFDQAFDNSNSAACRPNAIMLLSDGEPTSGAATFSQECDLPNPPDSVPVSVEQPWCGSAYLNGTPVRNGGNPDCNHPITTAYKDMLCALDGNQRINTYTIGFGRSGTFNPVTLRTIANTGGGRYFSAANVRDLDKAFNSIIGSVIQRAAVEFNAPTIALDGTYSGNDAFSAVFKPRIGDLWIGNLKKSCVLPALNPDGTYTNDATCLYRRRGPSNPDNRALVANPTPTEEFTHVVSGDAGQGGVGQLLRARLSPLPTSVSSYPRKIYTWKSGANYVAFDRTNLSADDLWAHGATRNALINRLHGYTFESDAAGNPVAVAEWPLGEAMNGKPLVLKYPAARYVLFPANDGMLHVFDSESGEEKSALIPKDALTPGSSVANFSLRDIFDIASDDLRHAYFVDSSPTLYHEDANGDGVIDPTETARVVFGLGRGGAGYYMLDMGIFNGVFDSGTNRVYPLTRMAGGQFADLADTWSPPFLGFMRVNGARKRVAIFGSGHERGYDRATASVPADLPGPWVVSGPMNRSCFDAVAGSTIAQGLCSVWTASGYPDPTPTSLVMGPITMNNAVAYRVRFSRVDLDPQDRIEIQSSSGDIADSVTGTMAGGYTTKWVYSDQLVLQLVTDGHATANQGYVIDSIDYKTASPGPTTTRRPSIFVVDLEKWNGATPQAFSGALNDQGMLLRFTSECTSPDPRCFDRHQSGYDDLKYMTCPISAEVAVLDNAGVVDRAYVGDECGQLWRMAFDATASRWRVNRIFNANEDIFPSVWPSSGSGVSTAIRKFHRRVDLVRSRCTGVPTVAVYFGTGNSQRPNAKDELIDPNPDLDRRDVIGVLFDDGTLPSNTGINDLSDASTETSVPPVGLRGWYLKLRRNERALRDPLVFRKVAYFSTYTPAVIAPECSTGSGTNSTYAFDSCDAEAYGDANGDGVHAPSERVYSSTSGDIGAGTDVIASRSVALVLGEQGSLGGASLRGLRRLSWRRGN